MKSKKFISTTLSLLFLIQSASPVLADGLIVPPPDSNVTEANQEALIVYDGERENLILSVGVYGDASDFGWLIPVPSRPEVERSYQELFTVLGEMAEPQENLLDKIKGEIEPSYRVMLEGEGYGAGAVEEAVEVLEEKQIGVLDVAVLDANDPEALSEWLGENGYGLPGWDEDYSYRFPTEGDYLYHELQVLQDYIDSGWYFVAAKINAKFVAEAQPLRGEEIARWPRPYYDNVRVTPVHLSFETSKLVYPMKLTSLGYSAPDILLYVWTDERVEVKNYRWEWAETEEEAIRFQTEYAGLTEAAELQEWLPDLADGYLTKLYSYPIGADEMTEDLRFARAADQREVNTGQMLWSDWLKVPLFVLIYLPYRLVNNLLGDSYSYYGLFTGGGIVGVKSLVSFLGLAAAAALWAVGWHLVLRRIGGKKGKKGGRRKWQVALILAVQFPGVWLLANFLAMVLVLLYGFLMTWLEVEMGPLLFNLILASNFGAVLFALWLYKLQSRLGLT